MNYNVTTGMGDSDSASLFATGSYTIDIQDRLHVDTTSDMNTRTVADNDDINTLREAIAFANDTSGSQTITFQPSVFASGETITLSVSGTNQLEITDSVVIDGPGADDLAIGGNDNSSVFLIDNGNDSTEIDVTTRGVTIRDGNTSASAVDLIADQGAGIINSEDLTLDRVTVTSNRIDLFTNIFGQTFHTDGGGLLHRLGDLRIVDSTFSGNRAQDGGGVRVSSGSAEISNSTFSGNSATNAGGGSLGQAHQLLLPSAAQRLPPIEAIPTVSAKVPREGSGG